MRFYWLQDRYNQGQFIIYWAPGSDNLADYHTKHHPLANHKKMRPTIMHTAHFENSLITCLLRGCANNPNILTTRDNYNDDITEVLGGVHTYRRQVQGITSKYGARATNIH